MVRPGALQSRADTTHGLLPATYAIRASYGSRALPKLQEARMQSDWDDARN